MTKPPPIIEMEATFSAESVPETATTRALDRTMFAVLLTILLFGPLAFGATEAWSLATLQSFATLLFLLWCARQYFAGSVVIHGSALFAPAALFAAVVLSQLAFKTTAYAYATRMEAADYVAFALLLFVSSQLFYFGLRLRIFAAVLAGYGFLVAVFAILQDLTAGGLLYWVRKPTFSSAIYGPYVNRNHYAGLMEMLVPFALVLCFSRRLSPAKRLASGFAALVMSATIFLSGSRGGASAFIAEIIFLSIVTTNLNKRRRFDWAVAAFFVFLFGLIYWLDSGSFLDRWLSVRGDIEIGRAAIARDGIQMFLKRPFMGWGLGTFPYVYPRFRSFYTDYFINQAHNDWLQVLIETGTAGALAMLWFVGSLYHGALRRLRRASASARIDSGSLVRLAALTGCTGLLVHSLVDFNLHIPANAAIFFVLCAVANWGPFEREQ